MSRARDLFRRLQADGEAAIDEYIAQRASEEPFLDFKLASPDGNDRNNLAKAISGFGNSEGGVIVWGVDCRPHGGRGDVAHAKVPIDNPQRFKSKLEGAVSGCTVPPHSGVEHFAILAAADPATGFVVTLVPPAPNLPLQHSNERVYYLRAGSSFERIPHGVLAAMFGRPLAPTLRHHWEIQQTTRGDNNTMTVLATLQIRNDGPGLALDIFASINVVNKLRNDCECRVSPALGDELHRSSTHGRLHSVICDERVRASPGMVLDVLNVELHLPKPPENALRLECTVGCSNGVPHHLIVHAEPGKIASIRDQFFADMPAKRPYNHKGAKEYGRKIFNSEQTL